MNKENTKIILKIVGVVVLIVIATKVFLPDVTSDQFRTFVEKSGILGPLAIIGYIIVAHVIAPIVGSPVVFLGIVVLGIVKTMMLLYFASMASAVINFYISRKLGRKWVRRLVGENNMEEIDKFLGVSGIKVFVMARIFGFALFDVISYAAGFTRISFKKYFFITATCALIPLTLTAIVFRNFDFTSEYSFIVWVSSIVLVGMLFAFIIRKKLSQRLESKPDI